MITLKSVVQRVGSAFGLHIESKRAVPWGAYKYLDIRALAGGNIGVALDIGANTGQTVAQLRSAFPFVTIHAFEPVPETFRRLEKNVRDIEGVRCWQVAMGAAPGTMEVTLSSDGQNTLLVSARPDEQRVAVEVDTVDMFCQRQHIDCVDLLKIDTEGYEVHALVGAHHALAEGRVRFVLAECDFSHRPTEPHGDFREIFELLASYGYNLVATYAEGVDGMGWRWGDALFMKQTPSQIACSPYQMLEQAGR